MRWRNVPVPEANVVSLLLGITLHLFIPLSIFPKAWIGHAAGWPVVLLGIGIAGWAVWEVRRIDIAAPERLVTTGPYALSRNPMYVAWMALQLGVSFVVNTAWPVVFLIGAVPYTHFFVVRKEERELGRRFADAYRRYRKDTRRYL